MKRPFTLWILLGASLLATLLVLGVVVVLPRLQPSTPQKTAQAFCDAVNAGDLHRAYGQLSHNQPFRLDQTEADFDHTMENVARCRIKSVTYFDAHQASATTMFTPRPDFEFQYDMAGFLGMDLEDGAWKIVEVVPGGLYPGPLPVSLTPAAAK